MAVGTELLLGQIADTNSAWLGEHLAANGVASHFHQAVGDNHDRITLALRTALARSDGVIMCGGLGPTQDDITREAIAEVMNVPLVRDQAIVDVIAGFFEARGRTMSDNNARQADVPQGAAIIPQVAGTAPGLICPVGQQGRLRRPRRPLRDGRDVRARHPARPARPHGRVGRGDGRHRQPRAAHVGGQRVRAGRVPAGPHRRARRRRRRHAGLPGLGHRGDQGAHHRPGPHAEDVTALLDKEDAEVRRAIEERLGDIVFGVDDESMEVAVAARLIARGLTFGVAESLTGGLIASRLVNVAGASSWFRGGVVAYDSQVKFDVLGVPAGPVVTEAAAAAMAEGAARVTGADVGLGITGVAGPDDQEGVAPGHGVRRPPPPRPAGPDPRAAGARRPGARAPVRGHFGP